MKLSNIFSSIRQMAEAAVKLAAQKTQEQYVKPKAPQPVVARDGFEVGKKAPVNLGRVPSASAAADAQYVTSLYRELLDRAPDAEGLQAHLRGLENGMSRAEIRNVFLNSPEFQQRLAGLVQGQVAPVPGGAMPAVVQGVGPVPLEGYDTQKLNDLNHRTVKYQFGRVASHFSLDGVQDKAGAERLLKSMVPALEAAGLKIHEVKGDKIRVDTPLGQEWVDVVRGAGSGQPGWWWGSEGTAIPGTEGTGTALGGNVGQAPAPVPGAGGLTEPGAPLSTVPLRPEYRNANLDLSSPDRAVKSAAQWVKNTYPELMAQSGDRQVAMQIMTHVIGALRAAGVDATRVVNHPDRPMTDGFRYGSDALVMNGRVYDVFGDMGGANNVQALDVGAYEAGRARE